MTGNIPEAKPARAEASGDGASSQWPAGPRIILAPPQTARCRVAFHSAQPELQSTPVPYDAECAHGLPVAGVFEEVRTAMQLAFALIGPSLQKHPVSCRPPGRRAGRRRAGRGAHSSASRGRCWPASSSSIGPVRPGSWRAKALGCRMLPRNLLLPLCAANQAPLFFTCQK